jgi:putative hydrolase
MSELGPTGGGDNPFGSFLGDMMKMFMTDGPLNWQLARQAALMTATGGESEPNVDPLDRLRLEELLRVADLHVSDATGLATSQTGKILSIRAVTRAEWAYYTLDAYRSLFEALATALTATPPPQGGPGTPATPPEAQPLGFAAIFGDAADPESGLLGNLPQVLGPVMLGAQAGSLAGYLARRALGQYDLPIPRPPGDELLMVPTSINSFASDWSLPVDDVRLWVCLSEVTHHAVLGRPHVRARLDSLLLDYVKGFRVDPTALGTQLENLDLSDPTSLPAALGNPEALLGAMQTPAQQEVLARLGAIVAAIEGYVDHVLDTAGHRLISSYPSLTEALRRRRAEATDADHMIEQLLGLQMGRATFEQGAAFVQGVLDRAGEDGLNRLWHSDNELPTPAEIGAPGLWLARIDIPT